MKTLITGLSVLVSFVAVSTASAAEQSYPVKCRFFQVDGNLRPPLRSGNFSVHTNGEAIKLKLSSGQEELSINVSRGFERGHRGSEPTLQALEGHFDFQRYVVFYRNGIAIQHKDSLGKPIAVMSCESNDIPKIADRLIGTEAGKVGIMEAAMVQTSNGVVTTQPAVAPPVTIPSGADDPSVPPVVAPSPAPEPTAQSSGLPPDMAEDLHFLMRGN